MTITRRLAAVSAFALVATPAMAQTEQAAIARLGWPGVSTLT